MTRKGDFCDGCLFVLGYATCDHCEDGSLFESEDRKKRMDKKRFKWHTPEVAGEACQEKWLIDMNDFAKVVAIVTWEQPELGKPGWWGVYRPFRKKGVAQFRYEDDATQYAEQNVALGEKEEKVEW